MSIAKPFTFTANTYAKSSEVNANFDTVYSQVNTNISQIAQNAIDIDNLENNKADINGSTSQRFAVADAVSNGDAINKQTLFKSIGNSIDIISGLVITKDSGSPEDTIIVSAGSCYDSTKTTVLSLSNSLSKQNLTQAANATYYVYIIGSSSGSQTDILISESGVTPGLPSGYTLYRQIGSYTTDANSEIYSIGSYGIELNSPIGISVLNTIPDYSRGISVTRYPLGAENAYIAPYNGVYAISAQIVRNTNRIYINGVLLSMFNGSGGDGSTISGLIVPMKKGDTVYVTAAAYQSNYVGNFYPYIGEGV
jgi:hypothetical protein